MLWRRRHAGCHRLTGFCLLLFRENALTDRVTRTHRQPCDPGADIAERDGSPSWTCSAQLSLEHPIDAAGNVDVDQAITDIALVRAAAISPRHLVTGTPAALDHNSARRGQGALTLRCLARFAAGQAGFSCHRSVLSGALRWPLPARRLCSSGPAHLCPYGIPRASPVSAPSAPARPAQTACPMPCASACCRAT